MINEALIDVAKRTARKLRAALTDEGPRPVPLRSVDGCGRMRCPRASTRAMTPRAILKPVSRRKKTALAMVLLVAIAVWGYGAYHIDPVTTHRGPAEQSATAAKEFFKSLSSTTGFEGSVIVVDRGEVTLELGHGPGIGADTRFSIGSLSKQFTGMLFAELVASGDVRLSDRVSIHVPELRDHDVGAATVEQLLRMRSGLPYYYDLSFVLGAQLRDEPMTTDDRVAELAEYELERPPGSNFLYSNLGYVLLSVIAERATSKNWRALLDERVFRPAGLRSTGVFDETGPDEAVSGHLPFEALPWGSPVMVELPRWRYSMLFGAGGLYSTVRDLYRWDRYLARLERERSDAYALFSTAGPNDYAFGIASRDANGVTFQSHSGEDPGFFSYVARIPERGQMIAFLSNTDLGMGNCSYKIDEQLRSLLLGQPYQIAEP